MWLACIEPDKPDPDKRTCECPVCPNVTVRVVKYLSQQNRQPDQVADIVASATAAGTINAASTLRDIRFSPNSDRVARWECLLRADTVEKRFCGPECATLIQNRGRVRNFDSNTLLFGFDCCVWADR